MRPPGMKKAQLSISINRTNGMRAHASKTNQGAESPTNERATPEIKKIAMPNSARVKAVAFDTDINDSSAVVDKTTRTCLPGFCGGAVKLMCDNKPYFDSARSKIES
jgi:hypothetical protein